MTLKRDYSIDNIKGIMIFLVVLAHLFEFNVTSKISFLLIIIYSFHMPVFIYYSGYLAKYDIDKIIKNLFLPYIFVQLFGYCFYKLVGYDVIFRVVSAYASLWYMISLIFWYISIPFIEKTQHPKVLIVLLFIIGLIIGYDRTAGAILSVSRTIVFLPFFYLGYYSKKLNWLDMKEKNKILKLILTILVISIVFLLFIFRNSINVEWFYGSNDYFYLKYNPAIRGIIYLIAFVWILFFKSFIPNRKTIISKIGKNSLSIYLLHYFILYFISTTSLLYIGKYPILNCLVIAIIIVYVLSFDWLNDLFRGKFNIKNIKRKR